MEKHPRENMTAFNIFFFFSAVKIYWKGFRKKLEAEDLFGSISCLDSRKLGDLFEKEWDKDQKLHGNGSLARVIWFCFGKTIIIIGIIQFFWKTIVTLYTPEIVSKLISYFSPNQIQMSTKDGFYYFVLAVILTFFNLYCQSNFVFWQIEFGISMKNAVCTTLYRKVLKLNAESLAHTTLGKISTIITIDADIIEIIAMFGHYIWIGFVTTLIVCYMVFMKIGIASLAGASCFFIFLPLQALIGVYIYTSRLKSCKKTDERIELLQEILSYMKIIKMYGWEKYFLGRINTARRKELNNLQKIFYTEVLSLIIGELCNKLAFFLFILTYMWMGNGVTAEIIYYITTCFGNLEIMLGVLVPIGMQDFASFLSSIKRIESVLNETELKKHTKVHTLALIDKPKINFKDVTVTIGDTIILKNINLKIDNGLNILIGYVGSGKTTFLKSILYEYDIEGELEVNGRISYASQEPWLFPATIKENILFGERYSVERYQRVLEICALNYDLELFQNGDETIILDKGLNLSKGQQARINLARAIYRESDIYLLDDSLASLDGKVSDHIFNACMKNFLKTKICIFTTNNAEYIKRADSIISLNDGNIQIDNSSDIFKSISQNAILCDDDKDESIFEAIPETKNVYKERKNSGVVPTKIYLQYIKYGGGIIIFTILVGLFIIHQTTVGMSDKLMSKWVTLEQNLSNYEFKNSTTYKDTFEKRTNQLNLYILLTSISFVLALIRTISFFTFVRQASINIHKHVVKRIMHSTMYIFDSVLIGNILNRFSMDFLVMDAWLPFILSEGIKTIFIITSGVLLIISVNLEFLIGILILFFISYGIRELYQPAGRNLMRLNHIARSPMIGHLNATLEGLITIRASNAEDKVKAEFERHQDHYTSLNYTHVYCSRGLSYFLEFVGSVFVILLIIRFFISSGDAEVGDVGLVITQSFVITGLISQLLRTITNCEIRMTSTERILEYAEFPNETTEGNDGKNSETSGRIIFQNVFLNYNDSSMRILSNVNFKLEKGDKLGIVGRTGAGKSSIISCLLRLYEFDGQILIDGNDIKSLSLKYLRSQIAVIPQDPILFTGSIRNNFDPLEMYKDEEIWNVIRELKLNYCIDNLNTVVDKSSNFSAGQKQLICLGRVILRQNKIIILDEATANVDEKTDSLISDTVEKYFSECTVIIIAHRLQSVLRCNYVLVLEKGEILEFGKPSELLQNENSFLKYGVK